LLISVRDQGIGIPQHELTRIFERFYRVDNSNTRRIGGTGLGLAITRALVELHGGRVWVDSTPGEGSTFYVTLPIATEMLRTRNH
jgi:signal transduction histidine kinase